MSRANMNRAKRLAQVRGQLEEFAQAAGQGQLSDRAKRSREEFQEELVRLLCEDESVRVRAAHGNRQPTNHGGPIMRRKSKSPKAYEDGLLRQANGLRVKINDPAINADLRRCRRRELAGVLVALECARMPLQTKPDRKGRRALQQLLLCDPDRFRQALASLSETHPIPIQPPEANPTITP